MLAWCRIMSVSSLPVSPIPLPHFHHWNPKPSPTRHWKWECLSLRLLIFKARPQFNYRTTRIQSHKKCLVSPDVSKYSISTAIMEGTILSKTIQSIQLRMHFHLAAKILTNRSTQLRQIKIKTLVRITRLIPARTSHQLNYTIQSAVWKKQSIIETILFTNKVWVTNSPVESYWEVISFLEEVLAFVIVIVFRTLLPFSNRLQVNMLLQFSNPKDLLSISQLDRLQSWIVVWKNRTPSPEIH